MQICNTLHLFTVIETFSMNYNTTLLNQFLTQLFLACVIKDWNNFLDNLLRYIGNGFSIQILMEANTDDYMKKCNIFHGGNTCIASLLYINMSSIEPFVLIKILKTIVDNGYRMHQISYARKAHKNPFFGDSIFTSIMDLFIKNVYSHKYVPNYYSKEYTDWKKQCDAIEIYENYAKNNNIPNKWTKFENKHKKRSLGYYNIVTDDYELYYSTTLYTYSTFKSLYTWLGPLEMLNYTCASVSLLEKKMLDEGKSLRMKTCVVQNDYLKMGEMLMIEINKNHIFVPKYNMLIKYELVEKTMLSEEVLIQSKIDVKKSLACQNMFHNSHFRDISFV